MKIFFLLIAVWITGAVYSQNSRPIDWRADLEYLARELPARHYNLFAVKSEADLLSGLERIKADADRLDDYRIAVEVQQLLAGMGDSHTSLDLGRLTDKNRMLPIRCYWFADGLFILHTTRENAGILGRRIVSVNGTALQTVVDSLATLVTVDNDAILKESIPYLLPAVQTLEAFGFAAGDQVELGVQDAGGVYTTHIVRAAAMNRDDRISVRPDSVALCYRNERALFADSYLPADRIYYLQYNKCWSRELESKSGDLEKARELPSFDEFEHRVFQTLNTKPVDKLVFDVRFNGGGSSAQGTRFAEKLAAYRAHNPQMKVYVVLGRGTFSSAMLNAMDFRRLTNAVFVGEETAGKPNHFGEVRSLRLPTSGLTVNYSTKYFERTPDRVNTLTPDVKLESASADFMRGVDPVYEWISHQ